MPYLKLNKKPKSIKKLLENLFSYCWDHDNIKNCDENCNLKNVRTYRDSECKMLECYEDRYRSVEAVLDIVKTYFPSVSDKRIFKVLFNLKINKDFKLQMVNCYDIQKPTMYFSKEIIVWGLNTEVKNSNYQWKEIYQSLGFKNEVQVRNHLNKL